MSKDSGTFGSVFKGLGELVERLSELSERAGELHESGEFGDEKRGIKGVYGFRVRMGVGDSGGVEVEPFGTVNRDRRDESSVGEASVAEIREPMVDVFDEGDHIAVIAEMPGVGEGDLDLDVDGDILSLSAAMKDRTYRKEVLLPRAVSTDPPEVSCRNGIVEIKLR